MEHSSATAQDALSWYKDAIIYELHIKAFRDANGDGIGDFEGLMEKLDYLQELGVTAIWLLPFYPSPLRDDGYDIADYYSINPAYGNISQFSLLLTEAHRRNLTVITELVINHTSDQHPWFQRARTAAKGSTERNFYVWTDDPTQYKDVRIIFQDFETSNWSWDPVAGQYYWHRFFHHQPDLNYDNPAVQEEVFRILDYWCELGVDGFRLDAIPYLFERDGTNGENLPETHAFLKKLRRHVDEKYPGRVLLAEANMWPEDAAAYFGNGDECHMNYHFPAMPRMFMALQMEDRYPITDIFDQTPAIPDNCQWALFLRNHDELTLEMVTDEERDYMYTVYAKDPKARINLGIRHRLLPLMDNSRSKTELLNCLLFSLPGTPVIYYGDEIGMGDNVYLGDRDGVRTPMQWTRDRNAGFSEANPQKLYLPLILDPEYHYEAVNVETQRSNTSSLFWFMKRMIALRKKFKAFGRGDLTFLQAENPKIIAFTRSWQNQTMLIVANLSKFSQPAEIDLGAHAGFAPVEAISRNRFPVIKTDSPYFFSLGPYAFHWFVLEKTGPSPTEQQDLPQIIISNWDELLSPQNKEWLASNALPFFLPNSKWFDTGFENVYSISIEDSTGLKNGNKVIWLLLNISFHSGLPGLYQLPICFVHGHEASKLLQSCPEAVIARMRIGETDGIIADALYTFDFQQMLLQELAGLSKAGTLHGAIQFTANKALAGEIGKDEVLKARVHNTDRYNTSLSYDNRFFLKIYRKIDRAVNPDLEITRYLSEVAKFSHMPALMAAIEWKTERDGLLLGMMQEMVENHGDGYSYVEERINNFIERILARDRSLLQPEDRIKSLSRPVPFESLPEQLQILLGPPAAAQARLLGVRTGEMHLALASGSTLPAFRPEPFTLHYQRSVFSSLLSLLRQSFELLEKNIASLPDKLAEQAGEIIGSRSEIISLLRNIDVKKLDALKIRIHGNFQLKHVLLTGKDLAIQDYGGEPTRSFSERRLKRSPLRDIASMVSSLHYAAFAGFRKSNHIAENQLTEMLPFAAMWSHYMSGFFISAWLETVHNSGLVPADETDLQSLMNVFILQEALESLEEELRKKSNFIQVPMLLIQSVMTSRLVRLSS